MSDPGETLKSIQEALEPYIRPREEAAYIRRVLALHLDSCIRDGSACSPLALVESRPGAIHSGEARGLQKDYLEALNANISAKAEYARLLDDSSRPADPPSAPAAPVAPDRLEEHLVRIRLRSKRDRLQVVEKYLDRLRQKPAASAGFLGPEDVFAGLRPVPGVPREVVDGIAQRETAGETDLEALVDRLEKQVLRAKLRLKGEEQLLEDVRARSTMRAEKVSESAKLRALDTTRKELIEWMEAELRKASGEERDGPGEEDPERCEPGSYDGARVDELLASVREKYTEYVTARRSLLRLAQQQPQPEILPRPESQDQVPAPAVRPAPVEFTLTPYVGGLLSVAREQKALIEHKSHVNATIARQLKDNAQALDHLAEESHLLPDHPMPNASGRRRLGFGDALATQDDAESSSSRARPWVFAADSAKLATLEAVAEKIEEGQIALEGSTKALEEIDRLLGKRPRAESSGIEAGGVGGDIWLAGDDAQAEPAKARRHAKKPSQAAEADDLWSVLDGNLGLLGSANEVSYEVS